MKLGYFVPGIYNGSESVSRWAIQAQSWYVDHGIGLAAGLDYTADFFAGISGRDKLARIVYEDIMRTRADGFSEVEALGHSDGAHVLIDSLVKNPDLRITNLGLAAAAIEEDCSANGLNLVASRCQLSKVTFFVSKGDGVLSLPVISYGRLGLVGPVGVNNDLRRVMQIIEHDDYGHCDWVSTYFEKTMQEFTS